MLTHGRRGENATAAFDDAVPIRAYDGLKDRNLVAQLHLRSQVELAEIERYERSHKDRRAVLDKLRYLRDAEPLEGYDLLERDEILTRLSAADTTTLGRVRGYEMKLRGRTDVLAGLAGIRAQRVPAQSTGSQAPADPGPSPEGGGAMPGASTAGIFGLIGVAAVLLLALTLILAFLIVAAVAPGLLT
jgi:hypothetical protein